MSRTVQKTMTYGVMHLCVAVAVAYALTRSWPIALAVGLVEPLVQTFAFAIHERLWSRCEGGEKAATQSCRHGAFWLRRPASQA